VSQDSGGNYRLPVRHETSRRSPVSYHALGLADAAHAAPVNALALKVAGAERKAFKLQRLGQYEKAVDLLETLIADPRLTGEVQRRAWLSATAARIAYQMGAEERGQKLQTRAFSVSNNHSPPKVRPPYVARQIPGKQSAAIIDRMLEYDLRGSMIADFEEAVAELVPRHRLRAMRKRSPASGASWDSTPSDLRRFMARDRMSCGGPTPPSTS
jgi:hypothetical protein